MVACKQATGGVKPYLKLLTLLALLLLLDPLELNVIHYYE